MRTAKRHQFAPDTTTRAQSTFLTLGVVASVVLYALTLTACGDEMPDKRVEQTESRKSNSQLRADQLNRDGVNRCHACNDNAECYCWWEDVDGQPACVEVDRGLHQAECAQFLIDEYCGFYPHEKECQEDK